MPNHPPIPVDTIAPVLLVNDIHASVAWYTEKLGFSVDQIWGEPPTFAMANLNEMTIMLKQSKNGPRNNAESDPHMWDVYIWIDDMPAALARLKQHNIGLNRGPDQMDYGCLEIEILDPDGHIICLGECD